MSDFDEEGELEGVEGIGGNRIPDYNRNNAAQTSQSCVTLSEHH
jgi:hypothetical protein